MEIHATLLYLRGGFGVLRISKKIRIDDVPGTNNNYAAIMILSSCEK